MSILRGFKENSNWLLGLDQSEEQKFLDEKLSLSSEGPKKVEDLNPLNKIKLREDFLNCHINGGIKVTAAETSLTSFNLKTSRLTFGKTSPKLFGCVGVFSLAYCIFSTSRRRSSISTSISMSWFGRR